MNLFLRTATAAVLVSMGSLAAAQNIAVVNGKPISRAKADAFVQELIKQGQQDTPQLQALVRQELVDREILVQEAERRGLPAKAEVKFQLDNARQQVLINALVQDQLAKSGTSDADVRAEYDRLTKGDAGKEYRARHILVDKEEDAKAVYEQVQSAIQSGEPKLLTLTCEGKTQKQVSIVTSEISAVQLSQKALGAGDGKRTGFFAMAENE